MAGTYTHPGYQAAEPWREAPTAPTRGRAGLPFPVGRGWTQVVGAPGPGQLAGLGAAEGGNAMVYSAVSLLGATVGGLTVGFVASGDRDGAVTGGLFTAGLAGLADASLFAREGHPGVAVASAVVGLAGIGSALYRGFWR